MSGAFGQSDEIKFIKLFFDQMKEGKDIRNYIDPNYISKNSLSDLDWQCDYLMFSKLEITEFEDFWFVSILSVNGQNCFRLKIRLVKEYDSYYVAPSGVKNVAINGQSYWFVIPWHDKIKVKCTF